jgi:hypothetical protein
MKRQLHTFVLVSVLLFSFLPALSQDFYVIVGAFSVENNAKKFTGYARSLYLDATYTKNLKNNLHYVYVLRTSSREEAIERTKNLLANTEFKDAWVFRGTLGDHKPLAVNPPAQPAVTPADSIHSKQTVEVPPIEETRTLASIEKDSVATTPTDTVETSPLLKPKGKLFKF